MIIDRFIPDRDAPDVAVTPVAMRTSVVEEKRKREPNNNQLQKNRRLVIQSRATRSTSLLGGKKNVPRSAVSLAKGWAGRSRLTETP